MNPQVVFLKLGGSLITDKSRPETARLKVMARLAREIAEVRAERPELRLLLGHGSGSFGHPEAARHGTRAGARSPEDWIGFQKVWGAAHRLNRHVMDALLRAGLPAVSFPPSSCALCEAGELVELTTEPIIRALDAGLLPVTQGDVAFDRSWGATIVSTEQIMGQLAGLLRPAQVLLAGAEQGVYAEFPAAGEPMRELRDADLTGLSISGADAADVTGGMAGKVAWGLRLAAELPETQIRIFSGTVAGNVRAALRGTPLGTLLASSG
jgi:isopentenyl phosphate kinase